MLPSGAARAICDVPLDEALVSKQPVTVTGHRAKHDGGPWVVTKIEAHRPGS